MAAAQISTRRGAAADTDNALRCFYNLIRSPLLYIGCVMLTGMAFYFIGNDPLSGVVADPSVNNNLRSQSANATASTFTEATASTSVADLTEAKNVEVVDPPANDEIIDDSATEKKDTSTEQPKQTDQDSDLIKLNQQYLDHLRSLDPLPKKVHILFPDKLYYENNKDMPFVQHSIIALKTLNPDWTVTVYDNNDVDDIIRSAGKSGLILQEEADILVGTATNGTEAAHIVERSDIARLILMYNEGGFYLDADRLVSIPMSKVLTPDVKLCLPTHNDVNFCQDLQCTSPKNDLFLAMIQACSEIRMKKGPGGGPLERKKGWSKGGALFDMGPVVYNRNILEKVFEGVTYDNIGSFGGYKKARESLVNSDGLILTKRDASMNGLLLDNTIQSESREALYSKYGMKPWAPAVNALWDEKR